VEKEAARHSQVHHQKGGVGKRKQNVLSPPSHRLDQASTECTGELEGRPIQEVRKEDLDFLDESSRQ
jgi:hypothetical protein